MSTLRQVIHIQAEAPPKPALGEPCNGCGVCCLAEPCPVGMLISQKRRGACDALVWSAEQARYHCGLMLTGPGGQSLLRRAWLRWVRRLISAGSGCDASLEVEGRAVKATSGQPEQK